jgi:hypothetical protein
MGLSLKKLLVVVFLSAISATVFADNLYVSLSLGRVNAVADDGGVPSGVATSLMFGFDFNQYLAAELGYSSLLNKAGYATPTLTAASVTLNGQEIAVIGRWPINDRFAVFGRLGYAVMSTVGSSTQSSAGNSVNGYTYSSPSGMVWGPGVIYKVNQALDIRAGYNIYMLSGSLSGTFNSTNNGTSSSGLLAGSGDIVATDAYLSAVVHF